MSRRWLLIAGLGWLVPLSGAWAAEMRVGDLKMRPNRSASVIVSGSIDEEWTFGWTIMLELIPREGNRGTITFTPVGAGHPDKRPSFVILKGPRGLDAVHVEQARRESVDIRQLGDAWPGVGTFTAYDTQRAGSDTLNGAVDENGTFVAAPATFSGALAFFPVVASPNARGVWDVALRTSAGESNWEGVETRLVGGTIAISRGVCETHGDCDDRDPCTHDICKAGTCGHVRSDRACRESGLAKKRGRK